MKAENIKVGMRIKRFGHVCNVIEVIREGSPHPMLKGYDQVTIIHRPEAWDKEGRHHSEFARASFALNHNIATA